MQAAVEFILQLPVEVEVEVGQGTSKVSKKSSNRNRKKSKKKAENFESTTPLTVRAKSKFSEMKENISFQELKITETKEAKEIESISSINKSTSFSTLVSKSVSSIPIDSLQFNYSSNANHEGEKSRIGHQYNNDNKNDENNDDEKKNDHKSKLNYLRKCEHTGDNNPVLRNIPCISECVDSTANHSKGKEHDNILDESNYRDVSININDNSKKEIILDNNIIISDSNSSSGSSNDNSNTTSSNSSNSTTQPQSRNDVTHHSSSTTYLSESAAAAAIVKLGNILT